MNPIQKKLQEANVRADASIAKSEKRIQRIENLQAFAENTPQYLEDLHDEFSDKAKLQKNEMLLLCLCAGLQVMRQYLLTKFPERMDDQTSAKNTILHGDEHSDRKHRYYNPSLKEILTNPVPFDANVGANGALSGGGRLGHRVTAIGHDPLLGLIFGTANIATSTLTTRDFDSYHIKTSANNRDCFQKRAQTYLVLKKTGEKIMFGGIEGAMKVAVSFLKEIVHLRSDMNTFHGLPLPVISVIDGPLASELAQYGLDFSNLVTVTEQIAVARFINYLIAMLHYAYYDHEIEKDIYRVKTKKIIMYSNWIASGSNLAVTLKTGKYQYLDIGGIANTIYETVTSVKFMKKVEREYVLGTYDRAFAAL